MTILIIRGELNMKKIELLNEWCDYSDSEQKKKPIIDYIHFITSNVLDITPDVKINEAIAFKLLSIRTSSVLKTSLSDYKGKTSMVLFMASGCNFRCPYCYNSSVVNLDVPEKDVMRLVDIFNLLDERKGKISSIVISGGEALLMMGKVYYPQYGVTSMCGSELACLPGSIRGLHILTSIIRYAKHLGYLVKLDTNGSKPDELHFLQKIVNLDRISLDLKTNFSNYNKMLISSMSRYPWANDNAVVGKHLESIINHIKESIILLSSDECFSGTTKEVRTVLVPGLITRDIIKEISTYFPNRPDWEWSFSRFVPGNCIDSSYNELKPMSENETLKIVDLAKLLKPDVTVELKN